MILIQMMYTIYTKEDELFDYSNVPYYYRNNKVHNKDKNDDFSLGL